MQLIRTLCILVLCCNGVHVMAQSTSDSFPPVRGVMAGVLYGSIFAHSQAVQNTAGANPLGIELQLINQQVGRKAYNICRCYPRQSLLAGAYSFDNEILGWGVMAAYMLEPAYRIRDWLFFSMRGSFGVAYASDPYHANKNPNNQSYSTAINAYLMYGLGLQFQFSERTALQLTTNFQHISNGGIEEPNKGVNWPTVGLHYKKPEKWVPAKKPVRFADLVDDVSRELLHRPASKGLVTTACLATGCRPKERIDREHELAMACLIECGVTKLADIPHPHARLLPDAPSKSVDRRMGVFQMASAADPSILG